MARKSIWILVALTTLMIFAFQFGGTKIEPIEANALEDTGPEAEAVEAAKQAIQAEATVKDFIYQPGQVVEWQIGVLADGSSRVGYANYICEILGEHHALTAKTQVRIVDIAKISRGESFRSASLGHVACTDRSVIVP